MTQGGSIPEVAITIRSRNRKRRIVRLEIRQYAPLFISPGPGWPVENVQNKEGDFPPRMLRGASLPLEGGARGGRSRRPPEQNRRATESAESSASKFANTPRFSSAQGQGGQLKTYRIRREISRRECCAELPPFRRGGQGGVGPGGRQNKTAAQQKAPNRPPRNSPIRPAFHQPRARVASRKRAE